jgi:hypothetical protein
MWGSLLAAAGLSIAAALVMRVVQEASPIGYEVSISGYVLLVVLVAGPIFGLGIGTALTALIPLASSDAPAATGSATSADPPASQA